MKEYTTSPHDVGLRLDKWLQNTYPYLPHSLIEKALRKGWIKVDKKKATAAQRLLEVHIISVAPVLHNNPGVTSPTKSKKPAAPVISKKLHTSLQDILLYEDEHILVLNKPAGLAVQGGSGIRISLDDLSGMFVSPYKAKPKLVHRLDKDTSGILLLARNTKSAATLAKAFQEKTIQKIYWAAVSGAPSHRQGVVDAPLEKIEIQGREKMTTSKRILQSAITHYKVIHQVDTLFSWLELQPITGRTHQLRVHCQLLGAPIVGDGKYGGSGAFIPGIDPLMHLHARSLTLPPLFTPKAMTFTAPLPPHMEKTWKKFGLDNLL